MKDNLLELGDFYLFTVHNMCGEYKVYFGYKHEDADEANYIIKLGKRTIIDPKEEYADDYYVDPDYEKRQEQALPYLQKICDEAHKKKEPLPFLRDKLEKFGDPHWSPVPWEQPPLPKGAIE